MTFFAVADFLLQWRQKVERYICWLKVFGIGVSYVMREGTERGLAWCRRWLGVGSAGSREDSCHQASCYGFHITLDTTDLSCEQYARVRLHLQRLVQKCWGVDVGVAVNLAIAQEPGIFESGDQAHDTGLLSKLQMILESHEIVRIGA